MKRELLDAHRVRAGVIGLLECCKCTFPIAHHPTATGHTIECPAHGMTLSAAAAGARLYRVVAS